MSDDTMSRESLELFGALVSRNVADATHTTNLLLEAKDREISLLASALVEIGRVLDLATVIDRKTERALRHCYPHIDHAQRILDRMEEQS